MLDTENWTLEDRRSTLDARICSTFNLTLHARCPTPDARSTPDARYLTLDDRCSTPARHSALDARHQLDVQRFGVRRFDVRRPTLRCSTLVRFMPDTRCFGASLTLDARSSMVDSATPEPRYSTLDPPTLDSHRLDD
jgi:hypothetical protein